MKSQSAKPIADALIMFGLTGDLGEKKLFPALAELIETGVLTGPVIGVGRSEYSDDELWKMFEDSVGAERAEGVRETLSLSYLSGDSGSAETYKKIAERIGEAQAPVVYAAIPPQLFGAVAQGVGESALPDATRLVVEKPFGHDEASARKLHDEITKWLPNDQLFAVDHFLAKTTVENMMTFRAANPLIEASFRAGPVARIELTMAESFGVDGRGGFYDGVGALKDVVQNHLLQTLAILMMDPPADSTPSRFDQARSDLLSTIDPIDPKSCTFGQFDGYTDIEDVAEDSDTETYFSCSLNLRSPRWGGVDVALRTGKELAESYTEAVVVFAQDSGFTGAPNRLRIALKPEPTIALEVAVLGGEASDSASEGEPEGHEDDLHASVVPRVLWACVPEGHGNLSDYGAMLASAIRGSQRHFAQIEDITQAWRIVGPLLDRSDRPVRYDRGSMGPDADHWIKGPLVQH